MTIGVAFQLECHLIFFAAKERKGLSTAPYRALYASPT